MVDNSQWMVTGCSVLMMRQNSHRSRHRPAPHPTSCKEDATWSPRQSQMKGVAPEKKNSRFLLETLWWILGWQSHVCFWNHLVSGFLSKISKKKQDVPASRRSYHPSDVSEFLHGCQMMFDISFNSYEQTYWQIMINGEMETRPAVLVRLEFTIYLSLQYPGAHLEDDVVSFFGSQFPCDICV